LEMCESVLFSNRILHVVVSVSFIVTEHKTAHRYAHILHENLHLQNRQFPLNTCFCTRRVDVSVLSLPADSLYTITRTHTPVRHSELLTFPACHIHVVE
jgi:hypothetical protein